MAKIRVVEVLAVEVHEVDLGEAAPKKIRFEELFQRAGLTVDMINELVLDGDGPVEDLGFMVGSSTWAMIVSRETLGEPPAIAEPDEESADGETE
ncbi:MAG: hypothetical protein V1853_03250 [bacterium]